MLLHDIAILNSPNVGGVAQMVERSLSMREVRGSMPLSSIILFLFFWKTEASAKAIHIPL